MRHADRQNTYPKTARDDAHMIPMGTDSLFRRPAMAAPFSGAAASRAARRSAAARRHHKNQPMRALLRMSHQLVRHEGVPVLMGSPASLKVRDHAHANAVPQHGEMSE